MKFVSFLVAALSSLPVVSGTMGEPYDLSYDGQAVRLESACISAMPFNRVWPGYQRSKDQTREAYFVNIDAGGELAISARNGRLPPHTLRPMGRRPLTMRNGVLVTKVAQPEQFIVDFGETMPPLHVFANPIAQSVPTPCAHYFGPGEHDVGVLAPRSGETVYLDKGAVVYGAIFVKGATNVTIMGRGILDNSRMKRADPAAMAFRSANGLPEYDTEFACGAFTVYGSTNVVIRDITVRDTPFWSLIIRNGSKGVTVDNVKVIGQWRYNSDGFDICASEDVTVRNCFIRSFDDCMVARGPYLDGETTPVRNMLVENCVLWCDWGKNLEVWAGHLPCLIDGVTYRKNKLIGVASLPCDVTCWYGSTNTIIRNITMEDLEIDLSPDRCEPVFQSSDDQVFVRRPLTSQELWEITLREPCENLGNQQFRPVKDASPYRALVENVRFANFTLRGQALPFTCCRKTGAAGHVIRNVTVKGLPPCAPIGDETAPPAEASWLSVPEAPTYAGYVDENSRAADGTSWFACTFTNRGEIVAANWSVAGLGVFEAFANGLRVGDDFLKPGFTHVAKTKYAFSYDILPQLSCASGGVNVLAAEVSAGWWRDKIVTPSRGLSTRGFYGKKSAFRGELELTYADGRRQTLNTNTNDWRCGIAGAVTHAAIFDGEEYDARIPDPVMGQGLKSVPEINEEFKGEILPTAGGEVCLRRDLSMTQGSFRLKKGETRVVDFGQNCAAVPEFVFRARRGTVLTALPAEMLNDADCGVRGCDGPKGSVYRANLRMPDAGMRLVYTFAGEPVETYLPRFTYFGYRYLALSATDDVEVRSVTSIPVTSVKKAMETGRLEVGDASLDRFVQNVYWGMLSNYLSVPTDCPQRNERLGWSADTQVFCEAGSYLANTRTFFAKFTRDLRDSRCEAGGYSSVAPFSQYGNETFAFGWADAGVIVPWTIWRQFGDTSIVAANWDAMSAFVRKLDETKYDFERKLDYIYADWLSCETFETRGNRFGSWETWRDDPDARNYRLFLAACYWRYDALLMAEMADALGKTGEAAWFRASAARALAHIRTRFVASDGLLLKPMRHLQTACVFALKFGVVTGPAREATKAQLLRSIAEHDGCLQTGFLGTSFLMDVLAAEGEWQAAYNLLLNHKFPSWLYSVDQGATTVWERWNSYTKADGFGPVDMNSFNHYAYGAVVAWVYKHTAGIATDPTTPGFRKLRLAPRPDRRLGYVRSEYRSAAGLVKSDWRYEGDVWVWRFTVPDGVMAEVWTPGADAPDTYGAGTHCIRKVLEGENRDER